MIRTSTTMGEAGRYPFSRSRSNASGFNVSLTIHDFGRRRSLQIHHRIDAVVAPPRRLTLYSNGEGLVSDCLLDPIHFFRSPRRPA